MVATTLAIPYPSFWWQEWDIFGYRWSTLIVVIVRRRKESLCVSRHLLVVVCYILHTSYLHTFIPIPLYLYLLTLAWNFPLPVSSDTSDSGGESVFDSSEEEEACDSLSFRGVLILILATVPTANNAMANNQMANNQIANKPAHWQPHYTYPVWWWSNVEDFLDTLEMCFPTLDSKSL